MKYRKKMSSKSFKRSFTKGALNVRKENGYSSVMRGGYRL